MKFSFVGEQVDRHLEKVPESGDEFEYAGNVYIIKNVYIINNSRLEFTGFQKREVQEVEKHSDERSMDAKTPVLVDQFFKDKNTISVDL